MIDDEASTQAVDVADVFFASLRCKVHLSYPFAAREHALGCERTVAKGTTHAKFIPRIRSIQRGKRMLATETQGVSAGLEVFVESNTLIENKTFTLPSILVRFHVGKILQDAAAQMVNLLLGKSIRQKKRCGFFTTNASRTKQRHLFLFLWIEIFFRKF